MRVLPKAWMGALPLRSSVLQTSRSQLVRCVASSLYLQCEIINDVSVDKGWDDLAKGDASQSESSIDEGSS
jgi:hypothetical protein